MAMDLKSEHSLRDACEAAMELHRREHNLDGWLAGLSTWLKYVEDADHATFVDRAFQTELWDNDTISATGQGHVDVSRVLADTAIAERLWELKQTPLPADPKARGEWLAIAWDDIAARVAPLTDRMPRLKMYRIFASVWPRHFTTVAHYQKLRWLARAMDVSRSVEHRVLLHQRVLDRIDEAYSGKRELWTPERMTLPWLLFEHFVAEKELDPTELPGESPSQVKLNPLPADRRRRGMLAIAGMLPSVLAMLEFAKEGCKRADFLEHVRSINPKLATNSLNTNLNALIAEWGALRADGDDLRLTPRGEALLESGEPEEVSDWLLTRILGFDNLLYMLRERPLPQKQVAANLQLVNPGWTSTFAPLAMINWAKNMGLAEVHADKTMHLTDRGRGWASRIDWTPGSLAAPAAAAPGAVVTAVKEKGGLYSQLPSARAIVDAFPSELAFDSQLVARLHAGVWSHPRRHFAVLTGLSGAGKTLLALCYAKALWTSHPRSTGWLVVPVQPGWYDPSSLLGYVNPIDNEVYVRTAFLDFLLQAQADPDRPYTVLLDEMNLSHPEQYLAPLLSAMETGEDIQLHAQDDEVGGVPARIPYPENLILIGTVNMDETTHGLSDKILDRACVIEFWEIDVDRFPGWKSSRLDATAVEMARDLLGALLGHLRPQRLHFGWRTIGDVIGYMEAATIGGFMDARLSLDHAIHSKVLPKLRGEDTPRLRACLAEVEKELRIRGLSESARKVADLSRDLQETGSARYWR